MTTIRDFDYSIDVLQSLSWRYENSVNLRAIIQNKQNFLDLNNQGFWDDWFNDVFNLATANDFGLSVWAIILDLPVFVFPANPEFTWGFGSFRHRFGNGNFGGASTTVVPLTTDQLRLALQIRFFQLHSSGSVLQINEFFQSLFGNFGESYVRDNLDMTITFVFNFDIDSNLLFVLQNYDVLPVPQGVSFNIEVNP